MMAGMKVMNDKMMAMPMIAEIDKFLAKQGQAAAKSK